MTETFRPLYCSRCGQSLSHGDTGPTEPVDGRIAHVDCPEDRWYDGDSEAGKKLYGRLCLTCGFVVHGLYGRRPWPITRRCKLCEPLPRSAPLHDQPPTADEPRKVR